MKHEKDNNLIVTANEIGKVKWWNKIHIPVYVIFIIAFVIILSISLSIYILKPYADSFVCKSGKSKILIKYKDGEVLSLSKTNIDFEIDEKNKDILINEYLKQINEEFYNMTGEFCLINNNLFEPDYSLNEDKIGNDLKDESMEIGNEYYGYIDIPSTWIRNYDPNSDFLEFTNGIYNVSMLYDENFDDTAVKYFENYKKIIETNTDNIDIKVSSEIIGSMEKYSANVISYYNKLKNVYYSTYIFEDENSGIYFIQINGFESLNRVLNIPKSFRKESKDYR